MFVFAVVMSLAAIAQDAPVQTQAVNPPEERKICKRTQDTGSRMGSKRICKTAAEWRAMEGASNGNPRNGDPGQN
ncbi:hypothetical protein [Sphingomonas sp. G-3-2-10]|jgi:hypothetical protein|uniref:hypothetical protein n=1 Tax=Sphingomonas sp. G-3-2-10 TaxID=2728838 RepID=UPI00146DA6DF|nr:hypothetical protein [Sphingomonas sp. G-3-2-10]NML06856.1 hypothetical protein [Sphingomonas sp. G-3-2-10]